MDSSDSDEESYEVEKIVKSRSVNGRTEYFVKWKNYPSTQNTWEPIENLANAMQLVDEFLEKEKQTNLNKKRSDHSSSKGLTELPKKAEEKSTKQTPPKDKQKEVSSPVKEIKKNEESKKTETKSPQPSKTQETKPKKTETKETHKSEQTAKKSESTKTKDVQEVKKKSETPKKVLPKKKCHVLGVQKCANGKLIYAIKLDSNKYKATNKQMKRYFMSDLIKFYEENLYFTDVSVESIYNKGI